MQSAKIDPPFGRVAGDFFVIFDFDALQQGMFRIRTCPATCPSGVDLRGLLRIATTDLEKRFGFVTFLAKFHADDFEFESMIGSSVPEVRQSAGVPREILHGPVVAWRSPSSLVGPERHHPCRWG